MVQATLKNQVLNIVVKCLPFRNCHLLTAWLHLPRRYHPSHRIVRLELHNELHCMLHVVYLTTSSMTCWLAHPIAPVGIATINGCDHLRWRVDGWMVDGRHDNASDSLGSWALVAGSIINEFRSSELCVHLTFISRSSFGHRKLWLIRSFVNARFATANSSYPRTTATWLTTCSIMAEICSGRWSAWHGSSSKLVVDSVTNVRESSFISSTCVFVSVREVWEAAGLTREGPLT